MMSKTAFGTTSSKPPAAAQSRAANRFVLVAQMLVISAFGVGLSVHAGLPPFIAVSAAAALAVLAMAIKKVRAARLAAASNRQRRAPELRQAEPVRTTRPAETVQRDSAIPPERPFSASPRDEQAGGGYAPVTIAPRGETAAARPNLNAPRAELSALRTEIREPRADLMPPPVPRFDSPGRSAPPHAPLKNHYAPDVMGNPATSETAPDYWSLRPSSMPRFEDRPQPRSQQAAPVAPPAAPAYASPAFASLDQIPAPPLRETDVEAIQTLIKKLADEVNAAEQERDEVAELAIGHAVLATAGETKSHVEHSAFEPDEAVAQSLEALRSTAGAMRQPSHLVFGHELPPPIPAAPSRASLLIDAIRAGRADVLLEPILGLQTQDAQHFEVSVRLRAEDGSALALDPRDMELRGTGLLPLFDAATMERTVSVARRLAERGKSGAVFSSYTSESLIDRAFLADATAASRQQASPGGQFVLTFAQYDARQFQAPEWAAIAHMRALGFRFALSHVTDLDMDLEALAGAGFEFVKLDADVFLVGLRSPDGLIPSADVCRYLAGLGLALVVERIDDEDKFARVFGFGALLGQGQLFGGARVLKAEASSAPGRSAA